jgi:hypothetical protein
MADTAITISDDRVSILSNQEILTGFTHKFKVLYSDVALGTGSTDTVTMNLGATPARFIVSQAAVNVTTAFAGTSTITLQVGKTGTLNNFIADTSVKTIAFIQPSTGMNTLATIAGSTATTATNLVATFTNAGGGSPSALTAGELDIYLAVRDTTRLP